MNLNLCTDPWLPVRLNTGACTRVSLEDFFQRATDITDLVLAAHERISIMRLLICIAQRAIDGPEDSEAWEDCQEDIPSRAVDYLKQWRHAFYLLGDDGAFLQAKNVKACKADGWKPISTISLTSAKGNNSTVFDNGGGTYRAVPQEQIAIDLITFQNFALGGTIGVTCWNGVQTGPKAPDSAPAGPCNLSCAIHLFIYGKNLLETLRLNLCSKDKFENYRQGMGKPVWEMMPCGVDDEAAVKNATLTYLGRLVPLSRIVKISTDATTCLVSRGISYSASSENDGLLYYESSMTVELDAKQKRHIVGADLNKAMWRSLPALLHRFSKDGRTFSQVEEYDLPPHYSIWVGAFVVHKRQVAKILGVMEDSFEHLTHGHIGVSADKAQARLMKMADTGISALRAALRTYHSILNNPFKNEEQVLAHVAKIYWGRLTAFKNVYLDVLGDASSDIEKYVEGKKKWASLIARISAETLELTISRNSVRQMAAWVRASKSLPTIKSLMKQDGK